MNLDECIRRIGKAFYESEVNGGFNHLKKIANPGIQSVIGWLGNMESRSIGLYLAEKFHESDSSRFLSLERAAYRSAKLNGRVGFKRRNEFMRRIIERSRHDFSKGQEEGVLYSKSSISDQFNVLSMIRIGSSLYNVESAHLLSANGNLPPKIISLTSLCLLGSFDAWKIDDDGNFDMEQLIESVNEITDASFVQLKRIIDMAAHCSEGM